jgi:DNA-sulfur modification-associated
MTQMEVNPKEFATVGVARRLEIPAFRYRQGGRTQYSTVISVIEVPTFVARKPDPAKALDGNRKVDGPRAKRFGEYVYEKGDWVAPAIFVGVPREHNSLKFEEKLPFGNGSAFGILSIPSNETHHVLIVDGQHRTLGFHTLDEIVDDRKRKLLRLVEQAEKNDGIEVAEHKKRLKKLSDRVQELGGEHITVEIVEASEVERVQIFADIANNAKGIRPDFKVFSDQRDVINRIARDVATDHPLFVEGGVEDGQATSMGATNPNLIGAKNVADIVRAVHVGVTGRVGKRVEDELARNEVLAGRRVAQFLNTLVDSFSDLREIVNGETTPIELRKATMLGSGTMLRVLAGVYNELKLADEGRTPFSESEIREAFKALAPKMREIPITDDNEFWLKSGAFSVGNHAPQSRQGQLRSLTDMLVTEARANRGKTVRPAA